MIYGAYRKRGACGKRGLDRTALKYIAVLAMLVDHAAMFFLLPEERPGYAALYAVMRIVGRLTGPIMCFFLAEGYAHTYSKRKYGLRLLIFGLISQIPYSLAHYDRLDELDLNMILTLFASFVMLLAYEKIQNQALARLAVFAIMIATYCCDWGVIGPLMVWLFYVNRNDRNKQAAWYAVLCAVTVLSSCMFHIGAGNAWYSEIWQIGMFLVMPLLYAYNGRPGVKNAFNKWVFYVIYPLHLLIIWLIVKYGVGLEGIYSTYVW